MIAFSLFPAAASAYAREVDRLFLVVLGVCVVFLVLVLVPLVGFSIRYRRARHRRSRRVAYSRTVEITWIAVPTVVGVFLFGSGAGLYVDAATPPDGATVVDVTGKRWMWTAVHSSGRKEHGSVHVPAARPVVLRLISEDVIHSFFVPALRTKQDALPGRTTTLWFEATAPGRHRIFCAEYCGTGHAVMTGELVVLPEDEYERFLRGAEDEEDPVRVGRGVYERYGCGSCHAAGDALAASLEGLAGTLVTTADGERVVADRAYLRESILRPAARVTDGYRPIMPTYSGHLSEEQLRALLAWIEAGAPSGVEGRGGATSDDEGGR